MIEIQVVAKFAIKDGNLDEFKRVANEAMAIVREKEAGTLAYDWYFDDENTTCVVIQRYSSPAALLHHIRHVSGHLAELSKLASRSIEVYGIIPPELAEIIAPFGAKIFVPQLWLERQAV
ncbi:MAG: antibiotic biosynthesis monooxygenase [Polyangiaceae bacterium]|nr:antibiotic biosynthesis monooxygenase [Polyangiaceae bacterium]